MTESERFSLLYIVSYIGTGRNAHFGPFSALWFELL